MLGLYCFPRHSLKVIIRLRSLLWSPFPRWASVLQRLPNSFLSCLSSPSLLLFFSYKGKDFRFQGTLNWNTKSHYVFSEVGREVAGSQRSGNVLKCSHGFRNLPANSRTCLLRSPLLRGVAHYRPSASVKSGAALTGVSFYSSHQRCEARLVIKRSAERKEPFTQELKDSVRKGRQSDQWGFHTRLSHLGQDCAVQVVGWAVCTYRRHWLVISTLFPLQRILGRSASSLATAHKNLFASSCVLVPSNTNLYV